MADDRETLEYHLQELAIARSKGDDRRSVPIVKQTDNRILDVGCGIGQTLLALDLPSHAEVHGIDIDDHAIAFGAAKYPALQLRIGSGEALPYADGFFDLVICRVALPYMNIPVALREFCRVLKPGGRVWLELHSLSMLRVDLGAALREGSVRALLFRAYALANTIALAGNRQFRYPLNRTRIESYQPAPLMRHTLRQAGFIDIRTWTEAHHSLATATRHQ